MRKAFRLGLLVTVVCFIVFYKNMFNLNPPDKDLILPDDTLPYNPHRMDSGIPDTSRLYTPRDTTPYKGNYIDVN